MLLKSRELFLVFCFCLGFSIDLWANDNNMHEFNTNLDIEIDLFTDGTDLPLFPDGHTQDIRRYMNQEAPEVISSLLVKTKLKKIIFTPKKITFLFNYPFDFRVQHPNGNIEDRSISEWSVTPDRNETYGAEKLDYIKALVEGAGKQLYLSTSRKVSLEEMLKAYRSKTLGYLTEAYGLSDFPSTYILNPTIQFRKNYLSDSTYSHLPIDLRPVTADFSQNPGALTFDPSSSLSTGSLENFRALDFDQEGKTLEILRAIEAVRTSRNSLLPSLGRTADGRLVLEPPKSNGISQEQMNQLFSIGTGSSMSCKSILGF